MGGASRPTHAAMTRVKICGITNMADAMTAVDAGADALGFILVENTPRFVTPAQVAPIVRALPPFVTPVGIFWDHPAGHVKAVAEACGLRALQFHGDEKPEELDGYAMPVIKTIKLAPPSGELGGRQPWPPSAKFLQYRQHAAALLLDSAARWSEGEPRQPIEWTVARDLASQRWRIILSAGLTPENVARAVATVRPFAVDVNSGVEASPGRKDPDKVWRFVTEAKGVR
jgi:phosphoribosylanthranilate isomerase